jgi:X-Pro dipeptidyl-peptidase
MGSQAGLHKGAWAFHMRLGAAVAMVSLAATLVGAERAQANSAEPDDHISEGPDGHQTEPVFDISDAITQNVWVESSLDSDGSGELDRIGVRIRRPDATEDGLQVPAIIQASPYNGGTRSGAFVNSYLTELGIDVFGDEIEPPDELPYSPNYFLARGYAVIDADMSGTHTSTGCPSTGGPADIAGIKAVIEWLHGEGTAYTTKFGDETVDAYWSTGDSALIGVSYVGTLATGVAVTGVEGLRTIVPIAAISNWYNYFRANGTVKTGYFDPLAGGVLTRDDYRECDDEIIAIVKAAERRTGNYNDYWHERNYLEHVGNIEASVFLVHGLTDWNVMTEHAGELWTELTGHDIPRKLWWHRAAHTSPAAVDNARWQPVLHRWFDHWLYGLDNGVMDEPMVDVQSVHDGSWHTYSDWPVPSSEQVRLYLQNDTPETAGVLTSTLPKTAVAYQSFLESYTASVNAIITDAFEQRGHRRVFLSPVLEEDVHLSGTPSIALHVNVSSDAHVSALLMDYSATGVAGSAQIVSRGWQDMKSIRTLWEEDPIHPQRRYVFSFTQQPQDYVFQAGRRIGVVVTGTDNGIFPPDGASPATFDLALKASHLLLPVVGGGDALDF